MVERLPVNLIIQGPAFDPPAVIHTLRHFAMHAGWTFSSNGRHNLIYATYDDPRNVTASPEDLVILSSPSVGNYLRDEQKPIPLTKSHDRHLPFTHAEAEKYSRAGWITSDVVAGAYAVQNLWFERRNRPLNQDGWIKYREDWWFKAGFDDPFPIVDEWFEYIQGVAAGIGWPRMPIQERGDFIGRPFTLVLTHDVDYLPGKWNRGFPRLLRTLARHIFTRRRPSDAIHIFSKYVRALFKKNPYDEFATIEETEGVRGVRSSFQVLSTRSHRVDPTYKVTVQPTYDALQRLHRSGWEICLHGSYTGSRSRGQLAVERQMLEEYLSMPILGHRQHYLNLHPSQLFSEVEDAGLMYDLSVGYNDRSGPRAGSLYPYKPYNVEERRPHAIWEFPFVIMDTTLATTYRMPASKILEHVQSLLREKRGCVSLIWHQEQAGGLLDPGFDQAYNQIMDWALQQGAHLTSPGLVMEMLESAWLATLDGNYDEVENP